MDLLCANAKLYNDPESEIYHDAVQIEKTMAMHVEPTLAKKVRPKKPQTVAQDLQDVFRAIELDDLEMVKLILSKKEVSVDAMGETTEMDEAFEWSALHCACFHGKKSIAEYLLESGANVELQDTLFQGRPLAWAAYGGHLEICKVLVRKYKADIYAENIHGQKPHDLLSDPSDQWKFLFEKRDPTRRKSQKEGSPVRPAEILKIRIPTLEPLSEAKGASLLQNSLSLESIDESESGRKKRGRPRKSEVGEGERKTKKESEELEIDSPREIKKPKEIKDLRKDDVVVKTGKIVSTIGLVSNNNLVRHVLSSDVYAHSLNVDASVRTINLRVLLTAKTTANCQVMVYQNRKIMVQLPAADAKPANVVDYNAPLIRGLNSFEVFALSYAAADSGKVNYEAEQYLVVINRSD